MKLRHRDISYLLLWVSLFILCSTVAEMQLPIAVLHIGPCKTSSTYIQEGINMFRDLLEKDNYHLIRPRGAKESLKLVDHDFAYALARRDNPTLLETYRSSLQQMREKGQNVIISSEVFGMPLNYPLHMKRRMDIVNFLEGFEVHLVVYHRDWLTHWISFFNYFFDSLTDERLISSSILAIPHVLTALLFLLKNKSVSDRTDAHVLSKYYLEAFHAQSTAIKLHIVDLNGLIAANADTGLVLLTEVLPRTSVAFKDAVLKEYFQRLE